MAASVDIRELQSLEQMFEVYHLYRQVSDLSEDTFRLRLEAMLAQGNCRCIAAFEDDRMIGASGFWIGTQLWCGRYIEADHVVVDPTLRSQGIGSTLVAWIEAEGERSGCRVSRIAMVLGRDRTHRFYENNGYFDDGLLMVKALALGADAFPQYSGQPKA
jgi:GNAT superfamily N-acetyltransferase